MKTVRDEFVEVFENYISALMTKQAEIIIEINSLQQALELHDRESLKYHLIYNYDETTGAYSYKRGSRKRIGF